MTHPDAVLRATNVGKRFLKSKETTRKNTLNDLFRSIFLSPGSGCQTQQGHFWAVRGVDLTARAGDSIGIIGVNGSGKSTLLRMLAGVSHPDTGEIRTNGDVQAIINLGAGFNGKLTGRENIRNALKMRGVPNAYRSKATKEIVDFAELGDFIDTPFANLSSGMKSRLGFSVCVQAEPDILIVDEALSVGDHAFRNKCMVRMQELKKKGTTMFFVSHSLGQVRAFCDKAIWLHKGVAVQTGDAKDVIESYMTFLSEIERQRSDRGGEPQSTKQSGLFGEIVRLQEFIQNVEVSFDPLGADSCEIDMHTECTMRYAFRVLSSVDNVMINLRLCTPDGRLIARLSSDNDGNEEKLARLGPSIVRGKIQLKNINLAPGEYQVMFVVLSGASFLFRDVVSKLTVRNNGEIINGVVDIQRNHEISIDRID